MKARVSIFVGTNLYTATNDHPPHVIPATQAGANDWEFSVPFRLADDDAEVIATLGTDSSKIPCHLGYFFSLVFAVSALSAESFLSISSLELKNCPASGPRWQ